MLRRAVKLNYEYPNAFAGVKKIFTAEILSIISAVALILAALFGLTAAGAAADGAANTAFASLGGTAIFGLGAGVVAIIAFIMNIVGINAASKDEPTFKKALIVVFIGIVLSVVSSIFSSSNVAVSGIFSTLSNGASVIVTIYVIMGIQALAKNIGNQEMVKKGDTTKMLVACAYAVGAVLSLISDIGQGSKGSTIVFVILSVGSAVFSIVQYVVYLRYLSSAKVMLSQ